jgi:hypothetical protein
MEASCDAACNISPHDAEHEDLRGDFFRERLRAATTDIEEAGQIELIIFK